MQCFEWSVHILYARRLYWWLDEAECTGSHVPMKLRIRYNPPKAVEWRTGRSTGQCLVIYSDARAEWACFCHGVLVSREHKNWLYLQALTQGQYSSTWPYQLKWAKWVGPLWDNPYLGNVHWERSSCDFLQSFIILCGCIGMLQVSATGILLYQLGSFTFPSLSLH